MTGLVYLDVAIGLLFTILVYSLAASVIQEVISTILSWRSAALREGVRGLLGKEFEAFWNRPLIESLKSPGWGFQLPFTAGEDRPRAGELKDPSYISGSVFAKALLDKEGLGGLTPAEIRARLQPLIAAGGTAVQERINAVVASAGATAAEAEQAIATWYDQSMERVSGWYVRRVKLTLFLIGFAMAALTNTNLFLEAKELLTNDAKRARLVELAEEATKGDLSQMATGVPANTIADLSPEDLEKVRAQFITFTKETADALNRTEAPIGWQRACSREGKVIGSDDSTADAKSDPASQPKTDGKTEPEVPKAPEAQPKPDAKPAAEVATAPDETKEERFYCGYETRPRQVQAIASFVLMGLLVTLGAQFWFDLLKMLVSVRAAGMPKKPKAGDGS